MTTLLEPRVTLSYLAYLGYPHSATSDSSLSHPSTPAASTSSRRNPFASTSAASATSSDSTGPSYQLLPTTSALQVTKPRRPSRRKLGTPVERSVFLAYVLGASGSGKTALLRAFVGKGYAGSAGAGGGGGGDEWAAQGRGGKAATWPKGAAVRVGEQGALDAGAGRGKGKSVVNCVEEGGGERYLVVRPSLGPCFRTARLGTHSAVAVRERVTLTARSPQLQEFGSTYESEVLRNKKKLELADVLVFVYDSSDTNSFSYVSNLRQQYKLDDIPTLFVATKSDLDLAQQVRLAPESPLPRSPCSLQGGADSMLCLRLPSYSGTRSSPTRTAASCRCGSLSPCRSSAASSPTCTTRSSASRSTRAPSAFLARSILQTLTLVPQAVRPPLRAQPLVGLVPPRLPRHAHAAVRLRLCGPDGGARDRRRVVAQGGGAGACGGAWAWRGGNDGRGRRGGAGRGRGRSGVAGVAWVWERVRRCKVSTPTGYCSGSRGEEKPRQDRKRAVHRRQRA